MMTIYYSIKYKYVSEQLETQIFVMYIYITTYTHIHINILSNIIADETVQRDNSALTQCYSSLNLLNKILRLKFTIILRYQIIYTNEIEVLDNIMSWLRL